MSGELPDGCPFHHLPPGQDVPVRMRNGAVELVPAEQLCDNWHTSLAINRFVRQAAEHLTAHTEVPPAFRKPAPRPVRPAWLDAGGQSRKCG